MNNNLNITIIQSDIIWENIDKNLSDFTEKIKNIDHNTGLIVLPEMFTTGFSMKSKDLAEETNGKGLKWMKQMAADKNCYITGSMIMHEKNNYFNRLIWMKPDGKFSTYDKGHLFRMEKEDMHYKKGKNKIIVKINEWRICPLICYDLRFPVWSRNKGDYDILIYIANWPESRKEVWKKLLYARAIENQCYVIAVNRIGKDGTGISYSGDSMIIDPKGNKISNTEPYKDNIETVSISLDELNDFRKAFPVGLDADNFEIIK
ncbi:MAG: amidohydrolase [Bacteroidales bacterium]|nr:amidohydrolase [Bacteroidales bacterium]